MSDRSAIAIIGIACRLPTAPHPAAFWRLLREGVSAISNVPADRWEAGQSIALDELAPGARHGGFLEQIDSFDAAFFRISPREAAAMDPQQRLVLELCWEAFEDGAVVPSDLRDSHTGVFVGAIADDYADLLRGRGERAVTRHALTGLHRGMIANRVSYTLGLRGPSLTVDTGQSSSLVAVHLACESLRRGESVLALAGGVHLNISPLSALSASRFGGLSADGRCFAFDARANGYVRGEGGGMVVLKPLSAALAEGDPIYCTIRGSAVNNDGGGDSLTAPNQPAQEALLRLAYQRAGVRRADVQYVELHGTGTPLGDRVEAGALGAVLGAARPADHPLAVGSAKTNVGHLEGAAGIVGLIKAVLCIERGKLPPSLNFERPAQEIPLQELRLRVQQEPGPWPDGERPRLAGVSSFGVGGTNCHVVLAEPPPPAEPLVTGHGREGETLGAGGGVLGESVTAWVVSGRDERALRAQAGRLAEHVGGGSGGDVRDVGYSLAVSRVAFDRRAMVLGSDRGELLMGLEGLAEGGSAVNVLEGVAAGGGIGGVAFVFPGQGSQWTGMAVELLACSAVFAERMRECEEALASFVDWRLEAVLRGEGNAPGLDRVDVVQPVLFAVMVSLARLWLACGVAPDAVVGHSQGEIAAAHVAGGLSLQDAAQVVALRSRALARLAGRGGMASVAASVGEVESQLERFDGRVSVAAVNGPSSVVVSGDLSALDELLALCKAGGMRVRTVPVDYAAHSAQVEEIREVLLEGCAGIAPRSSEVPFYSSVTGGLLDTGQLDGGYWLRNLRETVQFERATRALLEGGYRTFIEASPHPVLTAGVQDTIEELADRAEAPGLDDAVGGTPEVGTSSVTGAAAIGSLRRDQGGPRRFLVSLGEAWVRGVEVDWAALFRGTGARLVRLPTYAFQRERYWLEDPALQTGAIADTAPDGPAVAAEPPERAALPTAAQGGDEDLDRTAVTAAGSAPGRRLAEVPEVDRGRVVLELVRAQTALVLGHASPDAVETGRAFKDLGLDSPAAVELRNRLSAVTGLQLPTALLFDYPTPAALAGYLWDETAGVGGAARAVSAPTVLADSRSVEEPVAIVGMSCRYPGPVRSPDELWELVIRGGDAIGSLPTDRGWDLDALYDPDPTHPRTSYVREGGFLYDAGEFDAAFFGIGPREALAMDPQQRLLLEVCWEALEHAGIDPASLHGSRTGVFVGVSAQEYGPRLHEAEGGLEGYVLTGTATSVASGRLSYVLGLEGPAVTVDTACSSSLVALHLACGALRGGECTLALAGGASVMATPGMFVEFSRQLGLAPDGRCKPFAAGADGTGWSEGVGMLLLERLSDARRNGHPVLALLRGSAVNQDGASNGLTAPNGLAQQRVIRQALADAGLSAAEVDAVEAHGTGTTLGDPIEANALLETYGWERPQSRPLWLGSLKSNIGHTQAAAGVAGVIKMVMALRHGVLPRTLHVDEPSRHVDWAAGAVSLLRDEVPWPGNGEPRRAAVSSFGVSGTNAHAIIEEAPPAPSIVAPTGARMCGGVVPWVVSGRGEAALRAQAARLEAFVAGDPEVEPEDVGLSLAGRTVFEHRAVILGEGQEQLLGGLRALARGEGAGTVVGVAAEGGRQTAFLFTGQGAQRVGMGRECYAAFPVFRAAFDEVCAQLDPHLGRSLREIVLEGGEPVDEGEGALAGAGEGALRDGGAGGPVGEGAGGGVLDGTVFAQPGLFALEVALFRLVRSWGVRPDFLIGHSVGELAAAHAAGVLSLEDACRLVAARGRLMGELPAGGAMVAIGAPEDEVRGSLEGLEAQVALAAVNAPGSVVVSGDEGAVLELAGVWEARGAKTRRLRVSHAFHSPRMEGMLERFARVAEGVVFGEPRIPVVCNLTGAPAADGELCSAGYWVRHVRETVRFADGVRWLYAHGVRSFLELGPDGVLSAMVQECVDAERVAAGRETAGGARVTAAPVLREGRGEARSMLEGLGEVWVDGVGVDWAGLFAGSGAVRVGLPPYAFQRERYWVELDSCGGGARRSVVDGWRYRVRWRPVGDVGMGALAGVWLVAVPAGGCDGGLIEGVVGELAARGARPVVVEVEGDGVDREGLAGRLRALLAGELVASELVQGTGREGVGSEGDGADVSGVVSLLALGGGSHAACTPVPAGLAGTLVLVQALGDAGVQAPLWCVSSGAVSVGTGDRVVSPGQGSMWGLGRVVGLEEPRRWGGLVDLPVEPDELALKRLCGALAGAGGEDELAVRAGGVFVRRVVRAPSGGRDAGGRYEPRGTVLVTGGTGALGGHVARWLAAAGAEHVLLVSRRGLGAPGAVELVGELEGMGARVSVVACDVTDRVQLGGLLGSVPEEYPLSGVFHAAGVLDYGLVDGLTVERVRGVLAAKADAAWHLHELTEGMDLSAFVLFSSIAGALGAGGQGAYAAGNAFLDALAEYRRGCGLPGSAVAWGAWAGDGMAAGVGERLSRDGVRAMPAGLALDGLQGVLDRGESYVVLADVDWERYALTYSSARVRPLIGDLPEVGEALAVPGGEGQAGGGLVDRLAGVREAEREGVVLELVRSETAVVLGHSSLEAVQTGRAFKDLGFDSLAGVQLSRRLRELTGLRLASSLTFDYPTPLELARYLLGEVGGAPAGARAASVVGLVDEPVAIVGMSCRYPGGVSSPEGLWELVSSGGDGISGFPEDRGWDLEGLYDPDPGRPGTSYAREGGFLLDVALFDAEFFGVSPREALAMDPQQRLLLEVSWEALEDAGIDPSSLKGTQTGVFAGVGSSAYGAGRGMASEDLEGYWLTGSIGSVASGRVAYALGLEGPAVSVDTACSSSLVALHLACGALRGGECSLALAGGVTVMATPELFVEFSRQRGLAADGRCKAFADTADGTGWAEGVGVLLLERLSDAQRNAHPVLALVRGSAVNQDGASNGLTAPNGPSQQRVIRQALAGAGLAPGEVDAVEGHGTGTRLGDPIEAQALLATYGQERSEGNPLWLGSVKSNIGHTQAAAGVAGVIKMVMAMRHGVLPRTLHVDRPTGEVDWGAGAVSLLTEQQPWRPDGRSRRVGVSSFGISGTNAHVVLEEAPAREPVSIPAASEVGGVSLAGVVPWVFSGRGVGGLCAQAGRLGEFVVGEPEFGVVDVGFSLAGRAVLEDRAVVLGGGQQELLGGVGALARGEDAPGVVRGTAVCEGKVAFLFTGQGAQRVGMGRELYGAFPVFRAAFDEVCGHFDVHPGRSLRDVVFGGASDGEGASGVRATGAGSLDDTELAQPGLFALEVALFELVQDWGLKPDFVVGHSIGELVGAYVAGVFSLEDACRLVAARGRLMGGLPKGGAMVAVGAPEEEVSASLEGFRDRVAVAAVNAPGSVVLSGDEQAVLELAGVWEQRGARTKRLRVSHAFHSPLMDGMLEEFGRVAESVSFNEPSIAVVSNLTGEIAAEELCAPGYWVRHVRETVRFGDGVRWLADRGVRSFLELGPDGVLSGMVGESLGDSAPASGDALHSDDAPVSRDGSPAGGSGAAGAGASHEDGESAGAQTVTAAPVLRSGRAEAPTLLAALAHVWVRGCDVDWARSFDGSDAKRVELPTYAFQRQRYWLESSERGSQDAATIGQASTGHPLLGAAVALAASDGWLFTGRLSLQSHPWLTDHVVLGTVVVPGTAFVELALHTGGQLGCGNVRELTLHAPLVLDGERGVQLQVAVGEPDGEGCRSLDVHSRAQLAAGEDLSAVEESWTHHASGVLAPAQPGSARLLPPGSQLLAGNVWPPAGARPVDVEGLYDGLLERGFEYGPVFQGLRGMWRLGEDVFAEVALAEGQRAEAGLFGLHPALLDAALHAVVASGLGQRADGVQGESPGGREGDPQVPFSWSDVVLCAAGVSVLRVRLTRVGDGEIGVVAADEVGGLVASVGSLVLREVSVEQIGRATRGRQGSLFCVDWVTVTAEVVAGASSVTGGARWCVLGGGGGAFASMSGSVGVCEYADWASLGEALDGGEVVPDVVLTCCFADGDGDQAAGDGVRATADASGYGAGVVGVLGEVRAGAGGVLSLLQDWLADERFLDSRLVVVTRGALAVRAGERVLDIAGSGVWGLVRAAQAEHPGRFVLVDVDGGEPSWGALAAVLALDEPQVAVREDGLFAPRLEPLGSRGELTIPEGGVGWRLSVGEGGTIEDLAVVCPAEDEPLGVGQVRVEVRAAGLNFRDVLIALGVYPGDAAIGSEGAGVVLEVAPGVDDLDVGDCVMGLLDGAFGSVAVTDRRLVVRVPEGWSFVRAASMPMVFLTAYYALVDLGGLRAGERVLVHAAAGGVGMAAVQLAGYLGAEVFGTASPGKWGVLEELGLDGGHVASSRSLEFGEELLRATGGRGVDVVLNSLAGEFVDVSLGLLGGGGRFIEMGKTDIRDPRGFAEAYPDVAYRAFDLMEAGPERIQEMLVELLGLFERHVLEPLPVRAWGMRRAGEAFRLLGQGRSVGKNVLRVERSSIDRSEIGQQGTVLVSGGTGGLGALLARHLVVEHGVRRLLLASRGGLRTEGAGELVAELSALGAVVEVAGCDVSDRAQVQALLEEVPAEFPLSGVVHAAGVLDDGVIGSLTGKRLERVLAPKVDGAWHLHELTEHLDLRMFVLFSSVAGTLGSPGQSNYASANAFLDSLAEYRSARGLAATSIAWGPWEAAGGMVDRLDGAQVARIARMGVRALSPELGLELFDAALADGEASIVAAQLDTGVLRAQARSGELHPMLQNLIRTPSRRPIGERGGSLLQRLAGLPEGEWELLLLELVCGLTAEVLGHASPAAVGAQKTFKDLGLDSLAAVELRNRLTTVTGLRPPATVIFDYPTPSTLAGYLVDQLLPDIAGGTEPDTGDAQLREIITSIPLTRLRDAGLLEVLLRLANLGDGDYPSVATEDTDLVYTMDVESLVQRAHENARSLTGPPVGST